MRNWEYDWFDGDDDDDKVWVLVALDLLLSGLPIFCCCMCEFRSNGVKGVFLIFFCGYINGSREGDWVDFLLAFDVPFCDYHNSCLFPGMLIY